MGRASLSEEKMLSVQQPVFVPAPPLPGGRRSALVIATAAYNDPQLSQLRSPVRDAEDLATVLGAPEIGGFVVTSLLDQDEPRIRREIAAFLDGRGPGDTVLIYLSCHGIQDSRGRLYFAATDTIKDRPRASAVKAEELIDEMDDCKADRQILILDCCFSGSFGDKAGGQDGEPNLEQQLGGDSRGREVLTASRRFEYSFEGEPLGGLVAGSVFTTGLVEGLITGKADIDQNGHITVEEAYEYAFRYVQRDGAPQTPQHWLFGGEGSKIVLARSSAGRIVRPAQIPEDIDANLQGRFPELRIGAVNALANWLTDADPARQLAARLRLEWIAGNDIPAVSQVARAHLEGTGPLRQPGPGPSLGGGKRRAVRDSSVVVEKGRDEANCVSFSPDGLLLASAGWGRAIHVRDVASGDQVCVLQCPGKSVLDVAFGPDGTVLASAGSDGAVRLWDITTGKQLRKQAGGEQVRTVEFNPDGTLLAAGHDGGVTRVWKAPALKRLRELKANTDTIFDVAFSPSGSLLATAGGDGVVRAWYPEAGATVYARKSHPGGWAAGAVFSPDGTLLAVGGTGGVVVLYEAVTGKQVRVLKAGVHIINAIAFSPDGTRLAVGYDNGTVGLWEIAAGRQDEVLEGHEDSVHGVAFSPTEQLIASAGKDGTVRLWR
jgi:dipeptidyl aminopeptidase/acylaminoacyl peptidase